VSVEDAAQAKAKPVPRLRKPMPILAPHSADQAIATLKDADVIALTLDSSLQKVLEALARDRAIALGPNISVASSSWTMRAATCWHASARRLFR